MTNKVWLDKKEVIAEFCRLQDLASAFLGWQYAADCFCGRNATGDTFEDGYRNEAVALDFIQQAILEKISREKNPDIYLDSLDAKRYRWIKAQSTDLPFYFHKIGRVWVEDLDETIDRQLKDSKC